MKPPSLCVESLLPRFFPNGGEESVDGGPAAHECLHFGLDLRNGGTPPVSFILELVDLHAGLGEPLPCPHVSDKLEDEAVSLCAAPGVGDERLHLREHFPEGSLVQDHGLESVGVVYFGGVSLHFAEFTGEEGNVAIALSVDQALLERGEGFRPRDRYRTCPPRLITGE